MTEINWDRYSSTEEEFLVSWHGSNSIAEVLKKLELAPSGGNYRTMNFLREELHPSSDHMLGQGQGCSKGKTLPS